MTRMLLLAVLVVLVDSALAAAAVRTKEVTYTHDGTTLKGFLAWDDAISRGKRPGVLVVHEWWGLNDYARKRAEMLAGLGYVAFACDMYGEGKTTEHPQEAGEMAGAVRKNVKQWMGRATAALKVLQDNPDVDGKKLAAIGYCFGGSTALQLAYSGADVVAVVSFHGALPVPDEDQAKAIKAKILICHGAADAFIPEATIQKVRAALEAAKADYQMIYYGEAVHSFTVPGADKKGIKGIGYNAEADHRSWQHMQMLFAEVFGKASPPPVERKRPGANAP
jgi:dienelactone hydrolase